MSYEIVKSIKVDKKNKKVYVTGASNNVTPRWFNRWENEYLGEILQKQGYDAVVKEILYAYYEGNFQPGGRNDYSLSLALLDRGVFNWDRQHKKEVTKEEVIEELYKNYMILKSEPKGKFIVYFEDHDSYIYKFTARRVFSTSYRESAKIFRRKSDAEIRLRNYSHVKYRIEQI